jgi:thioredoxin-related protein
MKKRIILLLIFLFFIISCENNLKQEKINNKNNIEKIVKNENQKNDF